ncbi:uncharacterized protein LOC112617407 [Theropithecus gelada]|uniref:uncharacterized protein LOC112617038 n=1 Tax=Theropithecus gelada TaxID=9565 RepID=UPI000DC16E25|nr:uncharacterized protein LOC112617038 [Theropithecus gelada]XP_025229961.1 uncharacterized protein LOC112617407 [Theropithecus gelada]
MRELVYTFGQNASSNSVRPNPFIYLPTSTLLPANKPRNLVEICHLLRSSYQRPIASALPSEPNLVPLPSPPISQERQPPLFFSGLYVLGVVSSSASNQRPSVPPHPGRTSTSGTADRAAAPGPAATLSPEHYFRISGVSPLRFPPPPQTPPRSLY